MEKVISYIVSSIAANSSGLSIICVENEFDIKFVIKADDNARSKIIGKEGKIINSIRDYLRAVAKKFNKKVYVEIDEN